MGAFTKRYPKFITQMMMAKLKDLLLGLISLLILSISLSSHEEGFHIYEYPGYENMPAIGDTGFTVHQPDRVQPPRVLVADDFEPSVPAPSDAVVLFDGTNLDAFQSSEWKIIDGAIVAVKGGLVSKQSFGDCQLHLEWKAPTVAAAKVGNSGNSGVFMMKKYEFQVYDSYSTKIYADGSAAAVYGQTPPLANVCRKPGEWQSYDIFFTAPVFDGETLVSPARITALHNGVLVQNNTEIYGPTRHKSAKPYVAHGAKEPFYLQGHGSPVQYRNIWVREL